MGNLRRVMRRWKLLFGTRHLQLIWVNKSTKEWKTWYRLPDSRTWLPKSHTWKTKHTWLKTWTIWWINKSHSLRKWAIGSKVSRTRSTLGHPKAKPLRSRKECNLMKKSSRLEMSSLNLLRSQINIFIQESHYLTAKIMLTLLVWNSNREQKLPLYSRMNFLETWINKLNKILIGLTKPVSIKIRMGQVVMITNVILWNQKKLIRPN